MEAGTLKDLIVETYKKSKEGNLVGTLYGVTSTSSFSNIPDIEELLKVRFTDMLHLQSTVTGMEEDIYERTLENYKVKASEGTIYIKLKDKSKQPFMYQNLILRPYLSQEQDRSGAGECMRGNTMGEYKIKNSKGEYSAGWVEKTPVFNRNNMFGERPSETGASNPIKLLSEENIRGREFVPASASGVRPLLNRPKRHVLYTR